jgi:glycosyltransferase involved in cell wall biosynthesis
MQRWVAKLIARFVFSRSAGVIGPNEFICQEYQQRYGVPAVLVRNPCDKAELKKMPSVHSLGKSNRVKIIYTGSIYLANYDCFRNLIEVMKLLPEYSIELHIFTSQTAEQLAGEGIRGDRVFIHSHVPYGEVLEEQRNGDILFLPLTFGASISEIVHTSAPGKLGEYLASGRPVLAHVPSDSFVAYYFQKYHCGLVASENNITDLKSKLLKLLTDTDLYSTIVQNARQRALVDFDPQLAQKKLVDFLNGN